MNLLGCKAIVAHYIVILLYCYTCYIAILLESIRVSYHSIQLLQYSDTLLVTTAASTRLDYSAIRRGWTVPLVPDITNPLWHFSFRACHSAPQRMTAPIVAQPTFPAIGLCSSPDLIDSPPIAPMHVPSTTSPTTHRHYHHIIV